jgi:tripartite-type tricarboxylate transporter receptor subunit TctC
MRRIFLLILMGFLLLTLLFVNAGEMKAQANFPTKEINILCGFSAGGGTDVLTRKLAQNMEKNLGEPVLIVNRPGGGGLVSMKELVVAKPDGYTLGVLLGNQFLQKYLADEVSWIDPLEEVTLIGVFNADAWGITVQADAPYDTLPEFVDYVEENPNVKVGAGSPGSVYYWAWEALMEMTDIQLNIVPYEGTSLALKAVAGGELTACGAGAPEADSLVRSNLVKMLGISAEDRLSAYPDVPTFKEQGVDFVWNTWRSIVGPAGIPKEVSNVLVDAVKEAFYSEDFQNFVNDQGFGALYLGPEEGMDFYHEQDNLFKSLMKNAGKIREEYK